MFKKWLREKLKKYCEFEEYVKDDFDKEHLYFVFLGITSIENYKKMKQLYFENEIHKVKNNEV